MPVELQPFDVVAPDGRRHRFPAGMEREKALAIVRRNATTPEANRTAQPVGIEERYAPGSTARIRAFTEPSTSLAEMVTESLPVVGGIVGAAVTKSPWGAAKGGALGASVREMVRAGAGIGKPNPETIRGRFIDIAGQGALQGAFDVAGLGVAKGLGATGKYITGKALPLVQSAIKTPMSVLRKEAGASLRGLSAGSRRMARSILRNKWTTPEQAEAAIQAAEGQVQARLGQAGTEGITLDTAARIPRYLAALERSASRQINPARDVPTVVRTGKEIFGTSPLAETIETTVTRPSPSGLVDSFGRPAMVPVVETSRAMRTNVSPAEGMEFARGTSRWGNRKAWGELKGTEQEASKTIERAVRDSVKEAVPELRPILTREGEAIRAHEVLDRYAQRLGNRDQIPLSAWVQFSRWHPIEAARALTAKYIGENQLQMGIRASDVGPKIMARSGATGAKMAASLRALQLALMVQELEEREGR